MEHSDACNRGACPHLIDAPDLEILWALDAYLQVADAYAKCTVCEAHYLIEMIDLAGNDAAFRVARLPADYVRKTVKSLKKGSCDITRARNEAFNLKSQSAPLSLILVRLNGESWQSHRLAEDERTPQGSWRDLPCDGSWLKGARSTGS